jgi:hypothetical protein
VVFKVLIVAFWALVIGFVCVGLELCQVRIGHRVDGNLVELENVLERVRRLEVRYNVLVSPDALERDLAEFFQRRPPPEISF